MIRHDVQQLTDAELNIEITRLCGVLYVSEYCTDLNAMHQAEEIAFYKDALWHRRYGRELHKIVSEATEKDVGHGMVALDPKEAGWYHWWLVTNATSRQKAEAFILSNNH